MYNEFKDCISKNPIEFCLILILSLICVWCAFQIGLECCDDRDRRLTRRRRGAVPNVIMVYHTAGSNATGSAPPSTPTSPADKSSIPVKMINEIENGAHQASNPNQLLFHPSESQTNNRLSSANRNDVQIVEMDAVTPRPLEASFNLPS